MPRASASPALLPLLALLSPARSWTPPVPPPHSTPSRITLTALDPPPAVWEERELWALEDSVPRYSLEAGRYVLWDRIALDVPELLGRSADELRSCWLDPPLAIEKGALAGAPVERPPRLERWEELADGQVRGVLYGAPAIRDGCVRATVEPAAAGSLAEAERWCVRTSGGDVFQLCGEAGAEERRGEARAGGEGEAVVGAALAAAGSAAPSVGVAAAVAALLVGGVLAASGGHVHLPHVDISVFVV
ncbi:hypothetical protein AB1Y20_014933 [Prymnesium parvum]|uniref:Uncharacterized protein n=1 Tax=Prymnesium parvum TaxID=97485 RepID=A0AB34JYM8_PRYPA